MPNQASRTHVEDVKDPDKVLLPGDNLVPIASGEDESVDNISFPPFDHLPMYLNHGPVIENVGK
jgi:hypothetical protein